MKSCFYSLNSWSTQHANEWWFGLFDDLIALAPDYITDNQLRTVASDLLRLACSRHGQTLAVVAEGDETMAEKINMDPWIKAINNPMQKRFDPHWIVET